MRERKGEEREGERGIRKEKGREGEKSTGKEMECVCKRETTSPHTFAHTHAHTHIHTQTTHKSDRKAEERPQSKAEETRALRQPVMQTTFKRALPQVKREMRGRGEREREREREQRDGTAARKRSLTEAEAQKDGRTAATMSEQDKARRDKQQDTQRKECAAGERSKAAGGIIKDGRKETPDQSWKKKKEAPGTTMWGCSEVMTNDQDGGARGQGGAVLLSATGRRVAALPL